MAGKPNHTYPKTGGDDRPVTKEGVNNIIDWTRAALTYDLDQIIQLKNILGFDDRNPSTNIIPESETIKRICERLDELGGKSK
ncbi:MAG: hypothetical protein R1F52_02090 [Candidatus Nitrosoabyssus spongiisocia]|nr:MAG: hypothetical protein R1F52_02090 [Nitrosopumilaceae archaeon AB1(1)]